MASSATAPAWPAVPNGAKPKTGAGTRSQRGSRSFASDVVNAEVWTCNLCERIFRNDRDMLLECEYCSKHFCIKCLNYKTHEYQAMMKAECMWFCLGCKPKIEKNIINEKVIEERCEFYLATMNDRLDSIERQLQTKCDADAVKVIVHEALGANEGNAPKRGIPNQGTGNDRDVIQETVNELKDREERQDNFIIFNAPEPNTNLKEVRVREDTELVKNLCNGVCEIDIDTQNDIADVIRLGRKPEGEGKPRPLKVLMKKSEKKNSVVQEFVEIKRCRCNIQLPEHTKRFNQKGKGG